MNRGARKELFYSKSLFCLFLSLLPVDNEPVIEEMKEDDWVSPEDRRLEGKTLREREREREMVENLGLL